MNKPTDTMFCDDCGCLSCACAQYAVARRMMRDDGAIGAITMAKCRTAALIADANSREPTAADLRIQKTLEDGYAKMTHPVGFGGYSGCE